MKACLTALVSSIIADKAVDSSEVGALRSEIYSDGKVEREEIEALFQINDACSDNESNCPEWADFLSQAVCDCVLTDDTTPGVLDNEEANWLAGLLMADGSVDETERKVLVAIRAKATSIDSEFDVQLKNLGI